MVSAAGKVFYSRRVRTFLRLALAFAAGLSGIGLIVGPAVAAEPFPSTPFPSAPAITSVNSGPAATELQVLYATPVADGGSPITSYQVSLDGGTNWFTCAGTAGVCPLGSLTSGQTYSVVLRGVNASGAGAISNTGVGVPAGNGSADKPKVLPKPRVRVGATFTAASNNLGVSNPVVRLGVGTLPKLRFSRDIPNKAAVERNLLVTATNQVGVVRGVPGAWGWLDDRTAVFRPRTWWPGNSTITIKSTLDNSVLGQSGSTYLVGSTALARTYTFLTGNSVVIKVDGKTDQMTVNIDGVKRKSFPVSLGTTGWETTNGVKVISVDKEPLHTYTSEALDITDPDEQYILPDVPWNTRLTPTGEFIHAAPWAYSRIGQWNGSHGCTNMFEADAKWIFENTVPGDVVIYSRTGGQTVQPWNGPGGLWNIPWSNWLKKSALHSATPDTAAVTDSGSATPVTSAGV